MGEFLDAESTSTLLERIVERDRRPMSEQEVDDIVATFDDWCDAISTDTEWDDAYQFCNGSASGEKLRLDQSPTVTLDSITTHGFSAR
jgi:hypothetical protein